MAVLTPLIYLAAVVAIVMMWRGLWGLLDLYRARYKKLGYRDRDVYMIKKLRDCQADHAIS